MERRALLKDIPMPVREKERVFIKRKPIRVFGLRKKELQKRREKKRHLSNDSGETKPWAHKVRICPDGKVLGRK